MIVGFTGTRIGMSSQQAKQFEDKTKEITISEFHHGDCVGSDCLAHFLIKKNYPKARMVIHPPLSKKYRAFCKADIQLKQLPYLDRNKDIVRLSEMIIAVPSSNKEKLDSGTWSTIRYARLLKKPIIIIMTDGTIKEENIPNATAKQS